MQTYKITDYLGSPLTIPSDWICLRRPTRPVDGTWAWRMEDDGQALMLGSLVDRFRVDGDPLPKWLRNWEHIFMISFCKGGTCWFPGVQVKQNDWMWCFNCWKHVLHWETFMPFPSKTSSSMSSFHHFGMVFLGDSGWFERLNGQQLARWYVLVAQLCCK